MKPKMLIIQLKDGIHLKYHKRNESDKMTEGDMMRIAFDALCECFIILPKDHQTLETPSTIQGLEQRILELESKVNELTGTDDE